MRQVLIDLIRDYVGDDPKQGAEIGVHEGRTSRSLIRTFRNCKMVLVDPWQEWEEGDSYFRHERTGKGLQATWDLVYKKALWNIRKAHPIIQPDILRRTGLEAVGDYDDEIFDFVFIDACHFFEDVKKDVEAWLPKVKKGGLLCGHDYGGFYIEVKKAVNSTLGEKNIIKRDQRIWGFIKP